MKTKQSNATGRPAANLIGFQPRALTPDEETFQCVLNAVLNARQVKAGQRWPVSVKATVEPEQTELERQIGGQMCIQGPEGKLLPVEPLTIGGNIENGPATGNVFHWNGVPVKLQPLQFRLVKYLWGCESRSADVQAVESEVWGHDASDSSIRKAASAASSCFALENLDITLSVSDGTVTLNLPS